MGATNFTIIGYGTTAKEAFNALVQEAIYEHGNDPYNGTISTCSLGGVRHLADKYTPAVAKRAMDMAAADDYGKKWNAACIDMGVDHYQAWSIKKVTEKCDAVIRTRWCVVADDGSDRMYCHCGTKKEADDKALEMMTERPSLFLRVVKRGVCVEGSDTATTFRREHRTYKTKPKSTPKGFKLEAIHAYLFYGWAAC